VANCRGSRSSADAGRRATFSSEFSSWLLPCLSWAGDHHPESVGRRSASWPCRGAPTRSAAVVGGGDPGAVVDQLDDDLGPCGGFVSVASWCPFFFGRCVGPTVGVANWRGTRRSPASPALFGCSRTRTALRRLVTSTWVSTVGVVAVGRRVVVVACRAVAVCRSCRPSCRRGWRSTPVDASLAGSEHWSDRHRRRWLLFSAWRRRSG